MRWPRLRLSLAAELELKEFGELAWRVFILVAIVGAAVTPWVWLWSVLVRCG